MEFENNTDDKSPEVSDAARLGALTKHISLTPIHADIAPEDAPISDESDGLRAGGVAFATIETETENTGAYQNKETTESQATIDQRSPMKIVIISVIAVLVAAGAYTYVQLQ